MNTIELQIRKTLDSCIQFMINEKEIPESCLDVNYDVWLDKKRGCYTTNIAFMVSKYMNDLYISQSYYQNIFDLFFDAFEVISLEKDYNFVKTLSDKQIECVLIALVQILKLKLDKKQKPVLPSIDLIIKKVKIGFDTVKNLDEKDYEKIDIHLLYEYD